LKIKEIEGQVVKGTFENPKFESCGNFEFQICGDTFNGNWKTIDDAGPWKGKKLQKVIYFKNFI
jgi:hypothetical protein